MVITALLALFAGCGGGADGGSGAQVPKDFKTLSGDG
jgi:hypothetical protein